MAPITSRRSFVSYALATLVAACERDLTTAIKDAESRVCPAGQHAVGAICVAVDGAPRPVAPRSLGDVTQRRPTLRWKLPAGYDGAVVELCHDRACARVIETINARGDHARPAADLPARAVVYWRLRARRGLSTGAALSATWLFHAPSATASSGRDASVGAHFDVNGDGYDDVAVSASNPNPESRPITGRVRVYHGSASGLATAPSRELVGESESDLFGASIASAGDINGDGFADLVVGAPYASVIGRRRVGAVTVFLGGASGLATAPSQVITLDGDATEAFGAAVASAGDVNGDGYDDVIIGAPLASRGDRAYSGSARVYHGGVRGLGVTPASTFEGSAADDRFGAAVASAGDINGDGYGDVIVGAWFASRGERSTAGEARVYLGGALGLTLSRTFEGATSDVGLGIAVASAGDVNGDGFSDVIIGASRADQAQVYLGSIAGLSATPTRVLEAPDPMSSFGFSVASAGDLNGDGFGDVIVGAYGASPSGHDLAGSTSVFLGDATGVIATPSVTLSGDEARARFGYSVAGAGDVDGDGFDDVLIGAYSASPNGLASAGVARLFRGSATGLSPIASRVIEGTALGECFGYSVARVTPRDASTLFALASVAPPRSRR